MIPLTAEQLTPAALYQQLEARIPDVWPALKLIAALADKKGWTLYIVGGAVRDLLLSLAGEPYPLIDIDLVVEGAQTGAGVTLAETIQASYPNVRLQVYGNFQTAALTWLLDPGESTPMLIDIATARTEVYPYPAANPEVTVSTLTQDLHRRDFTINAMAICLNGHTPGLLIDTLNGTTDLQQRLIRVLHKDSFIDDPTRIFRAVRFATRLDFALAPQTQQYITQAISSGLYARLQSGARKVPALQGRLKAEFDYLFSLPQWPLALAEIDRLGALVCVQEKLTLTPALWQQLRRTERWLHKFDGYLFDKFDVQLPKWRMLLELLLAQLEPAIAAKTAKRLTLDDKSQHRLKSLHQWESDAMSQLRDDQRPSQIHRLFHGYKAAEMLLMAARHPYTLGPYIWQYIIRLSQMPPLITGGTLKRLGYKPGPYFREILDAVHQLYLDGELTTVDEAEAHVLMRYSF